MVKARSEISREYKWDLSKIYASEDDFLADYKRVEELVGGYAAHKDAMLTSGKALYRAISDMLAIDLVLEKLWTYAALGFYVDTSDSEAQARNARVRNLAMSVSETTWLDRKSVV